MKLLFPDAQHRSPTAVSSRSTPYLCVVCEKEAVPAATLYQSNGNQLHWCKACEPYVLVVLPMAKRVRADSLKGEL